MKVKHLFGIGKTKLEKMLDEWVSLRDRLDHAERKTTEQVERIIENTARVKLNTEKFKDSLKNSKANVEAQKKNLAKINEKYVKEGKSEDEIISLMNFQLETYNSAKMFAEELEKQEPIVDANLKDAEKSLSDAMAYKAALGQRKALLETQISTYELNKDLFEMTNKPIGSEKLIEEVEGLLKERTMKLDAERWTAERVKAAEEVVKPTTVASFDAKEAYKDIIS